MTEEKVAVSATINAPADAVFAILADPTTHQAIDGTGWVRESLDGGPITEAGQIFRMGMHHDNHPEGYYEMANRVDVFEPPHAIAWQPGQGPDERGNLSGNSELVFGGWIWRYDLTPLADDRTEVTLSYDWSGVVPQMRDIQFPPFDLQHLHNSLKNLAELAEAR
ncbi:SRPBCC family protein [Mycobacterium sp. 1274761.0]|uniref:SRPBCC family protein n=1 Tax=Mycobacterium sp. 1274761.0 TaxID=1834077 RepID=UPI000800C1FD|nr:SRPBCC family protein [Mycobacterium sp. 1274761.0]OBK70724.1 polyketide cyclase [Mycobacterium sp. 1274761.0]